MNLSKSKYVRYCQCHKMLWMDTYMPQEGVKDESLESRFKEGHECGELAKDMFGSHVDATVLRWNGSLNISAMLANTKKLVSRGEENICEAAFSVNGCYCAVDLLHKTEGGYDLYEVKSSTGVREEYLWDIAYQKHVLGMAGLNITGTYLVHVNSQYVREGEIDRDKFFVTEDVSEQIAPFSKNVEKTVAEAKQYLLSRSEPEMKIGLQCHHPYGCPYWTHCMKTPSPSVFDLYRILEKDALDMYNSGIRTLQDVYASGKHLSNAYWTRQVEYFIEDLPVYVDTDSLQRFLSGMHYPMYFLDFETFMTCIPMYDGLRPYRQVPFQYSLHILESEGAPLVHKEFLAGEDEDPRRAIAESLVQTIPADATLIAYNMAFEKGRIKELAEFFPDLAEHLMKIHDSFVDLLEPFQKGYVYNRQMGGSFSIKSVLPALFPDDPELNYTSLEDVHNGGQATATYLAMKDMSPEDRAKARENLLKYCCLDSYGMVRIWQKLRELAS
ncbi:MAG: DUF2779 domain-containing protein [Clostridia bacterium]|nr:DUF2779 domain-containing protein [Clostridia bacterium]